MKKIFTSFSLLLSIGLFAQIGAPTQPQSLSGGTAPDWSAAYEKAVGDSCGAYFNNYIGLAKTSLIFFEELRTGNGADFNPYAGRGQRFHAPQPIEVSGLQFYSFQTNDELDSLMVVTLLYDWDEDLDSTGAELARDTVWVKHTDFTPLLTDIAVTSVFDTPVTVEEDYIVALYTPTNDSLKIITSSAGGDGAMEGVSFAYYDNPSAPSFTGWYQTLETFGPGYDLDYLIDPLVKYDLHEEFTVVDPTICPTIVSAGCVEYPQLAIFTDPHYNSNFETPSSKTYFYWGDGLQISGLTSACHTYDASGTYTITLIDSLIRHDFMDGVCTFETTNEIEVLDSLVANFSFAAIGLTATFDGDATGADSVAWSFGDGETSTDEDPSHAYTTIGEYDVWFYTYGPCNTDSTMQTVTITDVGLTENKLNLSIYPNPAQNNVIVKGLTGVEQLEIIALTGEKVFTEVNLTNSLTVNTQNFANGIYTIRVTVKNQTENYKLVVQH